MAGAASWRTALFDQYGRLIRHAGRKVLVFCQVGRFIEFYGPQRAVAMRVLRLVRVDMGRGG